MCRMLFIVVTLQIIFFILANMQYDSNRAIYKRGF